MQGGIKYHFQSLWYDVPWDWTQVFQAIGKHSYHYNCLQIIIIMNYMKLYNSVQIKITVWKCLLETI